MQNVYVYLLLLMLGFLLSAGRGEEEGIYFPTSHPQSYASEGIVLYKNTIWKSTIYATLGTLKFICLASIHTTWRHVYTAA